MERLSVPKICRRLSDFVLTRGSTANICSCLKSQSFRSAGEAEIIDLELAFALGLLTLVDFDYYRHYWF